MKLEEMNHEQTKAYMKAVGDAIQDAIKRDDGNPLGFAVVVMDSEGSANYLSNIKREGMIGVLAEVRKRMLGEVAKENPAVRKNLEDMQAEEIGTAMRAAYAGMQESMEAVGFMGVDSLCLLVGNTRSAVEFDCSPEKAMGSLAGALRHIADKDGVKSKGGAKFLRQLADDLENRPEAAQC